jgi:isopropylmalate/homocitrate/citramalate synthase
VAVSRGDAAGAIAADGSTAGVREKAGVARIAEAIMNISMAENEVKR